MRGKLNPFSSNCVSIIMEPEKGKLLISEPFISDPAFGRSVILLVEKNELGTVGFVLNYKLNMLVSEVLNTLPINNALYQGGPVAHDSLHFLYRGNNPVKHSIKIMTGLYWGGDFNELTTKIDSLEILPDQIRFFIGYSGWEPGQLEFEIKENTWIIAQGDIKSIFEFSADKLWNRAMKSLGGEYALMANSPINPKLN